MSRRLNIADYEVALTVDGGKIDPGLVYPLHQGDPFPGGHVYTLKIAGPRLHKVFTALRTGVHQNPDLFLSQSVFMEVEIFLSRISHQTDATSARWKFFLNSIHEMSLTEEELTMTGECSDVVK